MGCVTSKPTNQTECVICYDKAEKVLFPCGHFCLCDNCNNKLHDTYFHLTNIEKDFLPRFKEYYSSEQLRTCDKCGHKMEADQRFVD